MQKARRSDTLPQTPPAGAGYVPMEDAAKALFGEKIRGGADAARQRMLARRGLAGGDPSCSEDARQRMIERKQR